MPVCLLDAYWGQGTPIRETELSKVQYGNIMVDFYDEGTIIHIWASAEY